MKIYQEVNSDQHLYEYGYCFDIEHFKERICDGENEIILIEMKRDIGGEMWCCEHDYFPDQWDCGRECKDYNPCNGRNGRCRYLKHGFIETNRRFVLDKQGLKRKNDNEYEIKEVT